MLLSTLFNEYLKHIKLYKSKGTYDYNKQKIKQVINDWGDVELETLTKEKAIDYIIKLKTKGNSNSTTNKKIAIIKTALRFKGIKNHPIFEIKKLKEPFITYGCIDNNITIKELMQNRSQQNQVIILLLHDTGIRLNELLNIETKNINFNKRALYLTTTKNNKPRYVFFTKFTSKKLKEYTNGIKTKRLFQNATTTSVEKLMARLKKKYNIKKLSPHRFRHSLSSELYCNGCDILYISRLLGHSSVETTKRYIHTDLAQDCAIYDKYHKK